MVGMGKLIAKATGVRGDAEGFVEASVAQPPVGVRVLVQTPMGNEYKLNILPSTQVPAGSKWRIWGE